MNHTFLCYKTIIIPQTQISLPNQLSPCTVDLFTVANNYILIDSSNILHAPNLFRPSECFVAIYFYKHRKLFSLIRKLIQIARNVRRITPPPPYSNDMHEGAECRGYFLALVSGRFPEKARKSEGFFSSSIANGKAIAEIRGISFFPR